MATRPLDEVQRDIEAVQQQIEKAAQEVEQEVVKDPRDGAMELEKRKELRALRELLVELRKEMNSLRAGPTQTAGERSTTGTQEIAALWQAQARLERQIFKASHTTRTYADIGEENFKHKTPVQLTTLGLPIPEPALLQQAAEAAAAAFPAAEYKGLLYKKPKKRKSQRDVMAAVLQDEVTPVAVEVDEPDPPAMPAGPQQQQQQQSPPPGKTLLDVVATPNNSVQEARDMQPAVIQILTVVVHVLGGKLVITDTHASCQLRSPTLRPDASAYAAHVQAWSQLVLVFEFKLSDDDEARMVMLGQLLVSCVAALDAQEGRSVVFAVGISMNTLEVLRVTRAVAGMPLQNIARAGNLAFNVVSTHQLPFSLSDKSAGFKALATVLAADPEQLGFVTTAPQPPLNLFTEYSLSQAVLLRRGSAHRACSDVYQVTATKVAVAARPSRPRGTSRGVAAAAGSSSAMVLKLNRTRHEGDVLGRLAGQVRHVVRMRAKAEFNADPQKPEDMRFALLLEPYIQHLNAADDLLLVTQVVFDVATAVGDLHNHHVLHRDVTPNNFGHANSRGYLLDFSAAKDVPHRVSASSAASSEGGAAARMMKITGTLLWAPFAVLNGQGHTVSTQLDGLFTSICYVALDGKGWPGRYEQEEAGLDTWCSRRLYQFAGRHLWNLPAVAEHLRPLVQGLHNLFWPLEENSLHRSYRSNVTVEDVLGVCRCVAACHFAGRLQENP